MCLHKLEKMFLKNQNGMLHHILKLLRNLNICDNVGESKAANEQEQKRKKLYKYATIQSTSHFQRLFEVNTWRAWCASHVMLLTYIWN